MQRVGDALKFQIAEDGSRQWFKNIILSSRFKMQGRVQLTDTTANHVRNNKTPSSS